MPRYFTGSLLPQCATETLGALQASHKLSSNLWVPKRLLDCRVLQHVAPISEALVVPISALAAKDGQEFQKYFGGDVLLNACHTTSPRWFRELVYALGGEQAVLEPVEQNAMGAGYYLPLTVNGAAFPTRVGQVLSAAAAKAGYTSPFWLPHEALVERRIRRFHLLPDAAATMTTSGSFINADQTLSPGYFYARAQRGCYDPHDVFLSSFPASLAADMTNRARRYGYSSRLWLTESEAAAFGCSLNPQHRHDAPVLLIEKDEPIYAACQFDDAAAKLPSRRDISMLASSTLQAGAPTDLRDSYKRLCADGRAPRAEKTDSTDNVVAPLCVDSYFETQRLQHFLSKPLLEYAALRGKKDLTFISPSRLRSCTVFGSSTLSFRESARPFHISGGDWAVKAKNVYHVDDTTEPRVASELVRRPPVHFLTLRRLYGGLEEAAARYQALRGTASRFWVPIDFLASIGVPVPETAFLLEHEQEIKYHSGRADGSRPWQMPLVHGRSLANAPAPNEPVHAGPRADAVNKRRFVHVGDVSDPLGVFRKVLQYMPKNFLSQNIAMATRGQLLEAAVSGQYLDHPDQRWVSVEFLARCGVSAPSVQTLTLQSSDESSADEALQSDAALLGDHETAFGNVTPLDARAGSPENTPRNLGLMVGRNTCVALATLSEAQRLAVDACIVDIKKRLLPQNKANVFAVPNVRGNTPNARWVDRGDVEVSSGTSHATPYHLLQVTRDPETL